MGQVVRFEVEELESIILSEDFGKCSGSLEAQDIAFELKFA